MRKLLLTAFTIMLFSYKDVPDYIPFVVEGFVQDKDSGQPLKFVHIFTVKGEEEAVTDAKGAFRFESWKTNAVLTAEAAGYDKRQISLNLPAPKQIVLLKKQ